MIKTDTPSNNLDTKSKGTSRRTQIKTIFQYLKDHVATASMTELATGVHHKNICRYKKDLQESGRLWEVKKDYCERTGFLAWYLTTDPEKAPKGPDQLKIF